MRGLEAIYKKYEAQGLSPCSVSLQRFCVRRNPARRRRSWRFNSSKYSVTFPLFEKLHVKGAEQHPLYAALTGKDSPFPGDIKWNFGKFVISRDGKIVKRFVSQKTSRTHLK